MRPTTLEIVEDLTGRTPPDQGFLRLRRLRLRHHYPDGSASPVYSCDVVSRRHVDAVTVVLWRRGAGGAVQVVLKEGVRPPVWLRRHAALVDPDPEAPLVLTELPAGVLEEGDAGEAGLRRRAAAECWEETGVKVDPAAFEVLGAPSFPSPGISDERTAFLAAELRALPREGGLARGDGSGMEHGTRVVVLPLEEAIARCASGAIPDMKTEIGLRRLKECLARTG